MLSALWLYHICVTQLLNYSNDLNLASALKRSLMPFRLLFLSFFVAVLNKRVKKLEKWKAWIRFTFVFQIRELIKYTTSLQENQTNWHDEIKVILLWRNWIWKVIFIRFTEQLLFNWIKWIEIEITRSRYILLFYYLKLGWFKYQTILYFRNMNIWKIAYYFYEK